jgi:NTP pyrophosphatase (non-canonical NTP hydrolase)
MEDIVALIEAGARLRRRSVVHISRVGRRRLELAKREARSMTIDEYAQWVAGISKPGQSRYERLSYPALALIGEAGEVCDNIKNLIRDGTLNEDALTYEISDLMYSWTCLCIELGKAPSDMLANSRSNIEERMATRARVVRSISN